MSPHRRQFLKRYFEAFPARIMARPMKFCNSPMLRGRCHAVSACMVPVGIALKMRMGTSPVNGQRRAPD